MFRRLAGLTALVLVAFNTLPVRAADELAADPTTPKGAVVAFFKSMEMGELSATKALASGTEKQMAVLDAMVPLMSGFKALENSAVKKWGDDGKKISQGDGGGPSLDIQKKLKDAKEVINGDSAVVTPTGGDKDEPIKLKKAGDKWLIDLGAMPTDGLDNPAAMSMVKAMGDLAKSTAAEIEANKYANVDEAKKAMQAKMLPIIMQAAAAQGAGGAPAPAKDPSKDEPKK